MIDLHSHILFGLDDGPVTVEDSLALARSAVADGTTTMVATPHIDWRWGVTPTEILSRADALNAALRSAGVELEIVTGGEIAIDRYPDLTSEELDALTLGDGPYFLLECPVSFAVSDMDFAVDAVLRTGKRVLLAHPERCPAFQQDPDKLRRIVRSGALCQVTIGSLIGQFGRRVRQFSIALLREGLVHDVASDAHDVTVRPPELRAGLMTLRREIPGAADLADWLTYDAPAAILAGAALPPRPLIAKPVRRSYFHRS